MKKPLVSARGFFYLFMRQAHFHQVNNLEEFKKKALFWAAQFKSASYFESNNFKDPYSAFDTLIAAGEARSLTCAAGSAFDDLEGFLKDNRSFLPGFLSYDLKNEIEDLKSDNPDNLQFPDLFFFEPLHLILIKQDEISFFSSNPEIIIAEIENTTYPFSYNKDFSASIKSRFSKSDYIEAVDDLKKHIKKGEIYEVNFCQEFYAEDVDLSPVQAYLELNKLSPAPFSNFFKVDGKYIISATPERFLSRRGNKLISQPIKGTAKRETSVQADQKAKTELLNNEKELSENVMIVDLVRNDLTRSALPGTVLVEELFGIYSFKQVHQMISTVVCKADSDLSNATILKNTFPMGSMTGAPKISAMKLIEKYERTRRGMYSGTVGYFSPNGDFDFNVIIRSILYSAESRYLSFQVGSAITSDCDAEKEYEECLLKAEAILEVLGCKM